MNNVMTNLDLEKKIAEEILADNNLIGIDANDVRKLKERSDFIDGTVINGTLDGLGNVADEALKQIKEAHPHNQLIMLIIKIRVAEKCGLTMEHLNGFDDFISDLQFDIPIMWGIETEAPISDEVRLCVLCGFKDNKNI